MSDQHENESMTPEVVRQALLAEIDATKQAIAELSNEQLEEVVGGGRGWDIVRKCFACGAGKPDTSDNFYRSTRSISRETRTYNGGLRTFEDDYRAGGSPVVAEGRRASFDTSIHKIDTMTQASPEHK
jgi:hypothetical protein